MLEQVDPPHPLQEYRLPILVALVVTCIVMVVFYVRVGGVAPVASGALVRYKVFPVQTISSPAMNGPGLIGSPEEQDQLVVLAQVQIKDLSKSPLKIFDLSSLLILPQEQQHNLGASTEEIPLLFQVYPNLASFGTVPLARRQVIAPGETVEGLVVFNYPITQKQWDQRRDFQITVSFDSGRPVVLHVH